MLVTEYDSMSRQLTKSWMAGYILAVEDMQRDLEEVQKNLSGSVLMKYMEQKLKQSLKEAQESLGKLELS